MSRKPVNATLEGQTKGKRKYLRELLDAVPLPNLIDVQLNSYEKFLEEGLKDLFEEVSPIEDITGKDLELSFVDYYLDEPKYDELVSKERNATFEAPLRVQARLTNKKTGEIKEQEIYLGDFPLMTDRGTFIINGVERVVVSQLIRSPGVYFGLERVKGLELYGAKIIPNRGAWLEMETDMNGVISVKIDRKRKVAVTSLLRAFGYGSNEEIEALFKDVDVNPDIKYIEETFQKDAARSEAEGLKEVYKRIRPGDLATVDNARSMIESMFFDFDRYDFGRVGRYKVNQRLKLDVPNTKENRVLRKEDLVAIIRELIRLNNTKEAPDDIDHLGNRRVRLVGELIREKFRIGMMRMERIIRDRMSTLDIDMLTPAQLINARPVIAAVKEFFTNSQLSQFMDQTNSLSELEHKRRLNAMGPGGLSRERAGFEVRDVHRSHYGRICPIATPEGPNIGLIGHLACYARINDYGFIETPYRKVLRFLPNDPKKIVGYTLHKDVADPKSGKVIAEEGTKIDEKTAAKIAKNKNVEEVEIKSVVSNEIAYLNAFEEEKAVIAPATTKMDDEGRFVDDMAQLRVEGEPKVAKTGKIEYVDVSPKQIISIETALIPFLEHDDANRALMGSNMQRQAVSCVKPEAPVVGTGVEDKAAADSGQLALSKVDGEVVACDAQKIVVKDKKGKEMAHELLSFARSNQDTSMNQRPTVEIGDRVKKRQVIADGASTDNGELALGQNVLIAFMGWQGGNYEDAILLSEDLVRDDRYSSIHIKEFVTEMRETKLGPEVVTRDIPNISEEKLANLDEEGIVRIGAHVSSGDILVGKITPKGETELTAEERLLRAIFGEKARDVKDTSLKLEHGQEGKVVDVKVFSREEGDKLTTGVIKRIEISVAQLKKIQVGDKMAGRHGNKGVISRVVAREDMPFLEDGTPIDIILNPLGVISRMNFGQILEVHLGWAAKKLGYTVASPALAGVAESKIREELVRAGLPEDGQVELFDGRTGQKFDKKVTVGMMYMMKLHHLVDEKIHQRSIGPYSLVTQQPLGGKAQFGGQRFGEMEVWALEGYGAAHTLQEMLTIKSDDMSGRSKTYEAIVKNEEITRPRIPASFDVLVNELKSLCLDVDLVGQKEERDYEADREMQRDRAFGRKEKGGGGGPKKKRVRKS